MENKPICYVPGKKINEVFSGVPSFMGLPVISEESEIDGYDAVIIGAPWEGIVTWNSFSGCELSTKTIRQASTRYGGFLPEIGFDIFDYIKAADYGDAVVYPGKIEKSLDSIREKVSEVVAKGSIPIIFGGDHSIASADAKAICENVKGKVGVVHFDAHLDNLDKYGEEKYARCSPLYRIYEMDNVDPKNVVHVGIRGPRNNPKQQEFAKEKGATVITSFDVKLNGIQETLNKILEVVKDGTDAVYITVCSDALDAACNPGGPPDFCGLTTFELAYLLHGIAARGVAGFDFVEIYPPQDANNVSSHVASWMALYVLAGITEYKKKLV
ncbi:agmatinase family protein [Clostridium guangxiense]|uniref:agmatinase family protein n=1 Tax=Clostridium guangxiense TaxID=1662055 RepID=UPI001E4F0224|nr:agmatinase family protein [Clostridium guangxiense]MCD2348028.1 agmatinase family protein [Clostridium guangxiense]